MKRRSSLREHLVGHFQVELVGPHPGMLDEMVGQPAHWHLFAQVHYLHLGKEPAGRER